MTERPDPLELQRQKLSGEVDAEELQRRKIAAHQARLAGKTQAKVPPNARRMVDPIEARKKKLSESAARRRASSGRQAVVPSTSHLVLIVRAVENPPPRPQPKAARLDDPEDEITRRLREARERLKGL